MRVLLLAVLLASYAEAGPRRRPAPKPTAAALARPPPAGVWSSGKTGQVLATRPYRSDGRVKVCIRYGLAAGRPVDVRLEVGRAGAGGQLAGGSSGDLCRTLEGVREGDEARLVLAGPLAAELRAELSVEDANP